VPRAKSVKGTRKLASSVAAKLPGEALLGGVLRASPRYRLVPLERLGARERQGLAELGEEPDLYGVLLPHESAPGSPAAKAVDCDTALLFLTLREPGPLPAYLRAAGGDDASRALVRLVADGVLEVERGGDFVSGAAAFDPPGAAGRRRAGGASGRLAELSRAALRHAAALDVDDAALLAAKLYGYNRRPLTPRWQRRLGGAEDVPGFLGLSPRAPGGAAQGSPLAQPLRAGGWAHPERSGGWLVWRVRGRGSADPGTAAEAIFKLYVSPRPEALAGAGPPILSALAAARPFQIKIGAAAAGLLRCDKLVAYFASFERLSEAAAGLAGSLAGMPVQGVPFTAEIAGDGLLSWGVDPPPGRSAWRRNESWRQRLTGRLAQAIVAARTARTACTACSQAPAGAAPRGAAGTERGPERMEPWEFALERLRLDGVDTDTWTPGALAWREVE
jgi:hypothetical protein